MDIKRPFYALIGTADVALETVKSLLEKARGTNRDEVRQQVLTTAEGYRKWVTRRYGAMAKRGERLATQVSKSAPAKRAAEQTKRARSQLKGAATSVRKAAQAQADAAKSAAKKVG